MANRIDDLRQWIGADPNESFTRCDKVNKLATRWKIKAHGHFNGRPGKQWAVTGQTGNGSRRASGGLPGVLPYTIDDAITDSLTCGVEVTMDLGSRKRWLFFATPMACVNSQD